MALVHFYTKRLGEPFPASQGLSRLNSWKRVEKS
jgi:hypothetical protein